MLCGVCAVWIGAVVCVACLYLSPATCCPALPAARRFWPSSPWKPHWTGYSGEPSRRCVCVCVCVCACVYTCVLWGHLTECLLFHKSCMTTRKRCTNPIKSSHCRSEGVVLSSNKLTLLNKLSTHQEHFPPLPCVRYGCCRQSLAG